MTEQKERIEFVPAFPIDMIVVETELLRSLMREPQFEELRASIREHGVLIPIQLARDGESYRLVAGLRRLRACLSLGLPVIPALVSEMEKSEELWAKFAENRVRDPLSALDEGLYIVERMNATGETQSQIAAILGVSEGWVSQRVAVLRWPREIQESLAKGLLSFGVARELAAIDDLRLRRHYLRFAELDGCSVRQASDWRRKAARSVGTLVSSVPCDSQSEQKDAETGFQEKCFLCEKGISFAGGKYIRLCDRCEDRLREVLEGASEGKG